MLHGRCSAVVIWGARGEREGRKKKAPEDGTMLEIATSVLGLFEDGMVLCHEAETEAKSSSGTLYVQSGIKWTNRTLDTTAFSCMFNALSTLDNLSILGPSIAYFDACLAETGVCNQLTIRRPPSTSLLVA